MEADRKSHLEGSAFPEKEGSPAALEGEGHERVAGGAIRRIVAFRIAGELYGFPLEVVQEIQQLAQLRPLPDDGPASVGLIELRGRVVPVFDLRALLGLEQAPYCLETPMLFCHLHEDLVCLIVDGVEDVVEVPSGAVQPPAAAYALADRMLGTVRLQEGVLVLLDIDRVVPAAAAEMEEGASE